MPGEAECEWKGFLKNFGPTKGMGICEKRRICQDFSRVPRCDEGMDGTVCEKIKEEEMGDTVLV